jgi:hypothetical protein
LEMEDKGRHLCVFILTNNLIGIVPYSCTSTSHFVLTFLLSCSISPTLTCSQCGPSSRTRHTSRGKGERAGIGRSTGMVLSPMYGGPDVTAV